jgi:uncharacterized RDD family membrane protein YckC
VDPKLEVATPERVSLSLPIAGIGFRSMAYLIDALLLFAAGVVLFFITSFLIPDLLRAAQSLSGIERAAFGLIAFALIWGYWTGMELAWRGQTVGKRLMKIRVVKSDGSPIGLFESAVRNLLRIIDFMPACYPVGLISMLVDSRHRRLGDLVAGTMLVREETIDLSRYAAARSSELPAQEVELLTGFLARFDSLEPQAQLRLGGALVEKHGGKVAEGDIAAIRTFLQSRVK